MSTADRQALQARFVEAIGRDRAKLNEPIGARTTYRVGGNAAVLVTPHDAQELAEVVDTCVSHLDDGRQFEVLLIGRGSNMLVSDDGFDGLVIILGEGFETITVDGTLATAGGAANLPVLARRTTSLGLTGFEWAVGVPGSVGGALRMNAGGHGADIADSLVVAEVIDVRSGVRRSPTPTELELSYRHSNLKPSEVVLAATFRLALGDPDASRAEISEIVHWRLEHQPGGQNAGSVFSNPANDSAGRLIDAAGLKGLRIGSAEVSTKHANFIQVDSNGSADDVATLMKEIVKRVRDHCGIELEPETRLVGF
ncbi:MAG: UDP-N-acetylmuramate dehydrogenase [Acidimicrobiales bacterium]